MQDSTNTPNRRDVLRSASALAAAFAAGALPFTSARADDAPKPADPPKPDAPKPADVPKPAEPPKPKKVLFFTKSSGFEHPVIRRAKPDELSYAEKTLVEMGKKIGCEITATKDGGYFTPDRLAGFDAVVFYTTGDLTTPGTDKQPPIPKEGVDTLIKWVESGKGFLGLHSADDTFLTPAGGPVHPYIKLVGGEFNKHGSSQNAKIIAADKSFGPIKDLADFELIEEWYKVRNLSPDLHIILVQDTQSMSDPQYRQLKPYPQTWARSQGTGRVFYTSMGHREEVWKNPNFEKIVLGGLSWVTASADADVKPNLKETAPGTEDLLRKD
ncbi:MAG: hypothetical protein JWM97_1136 [Phycisphaerales bacterium]|nr:hypothetical protein [Phycisphaerales bacterium]